MKNAINFEFGLKSMDFRNIANFVTNLQNCGQTVVIPILLAILIVFVFYLNRDPNPDFKGKTQHNVTF